MKDIVLKNKKIIVMVILSLIIGITAFFLLNNNEIKENEKNDNTVNYTDEINEALDNMESSDSFVANSYFNIISDDIERMHNFKSDRTAVYDIKNKILHIELTEEINGVKNSSELYQKVEDNTSKMYNYNQGKWTYEENDYDGYFYNINFIRDQLGYATYTATKEGNKLIVKATYTTETMLNKEIAKYLDPEATYSYEFTFEKGYLIEYKIDTESSYYTENNGGTFSNFNEKVDINIPSEALKVE